MNQESDSHATGPEALENKLRRECEQLTYLPASVAVAIKFIELSKDPDAGPLEYARTISSDAALGTKILALANSSWYGVRNEVTQIPQAVSLLGLANIRTLAISYCMAGLHSRLKIPKDQLKRYWEASLCKGVAAKIFAEAVEPAHADEAFLGGLFQDVALPLMQSVAEEIVQPILQDSRCGAKAQIEREREALGADHAEVGRWLATKLELPDIYVDSIGFHHDADCLSKFIGSDVLANAMRVASLFPHLPDRWNPVDVNELQAFLSATGPSEFTDHRKFLEAIQKDFDVLYGFFELWSEPELRLADLMTDACEEIADATTRMVGQVRDLMDDAAATGRVVSELVLEHSRAVDASRLDPLTGALSRTGFFAHAEKLVGAAARHAIPFTVLYVDVDRFKETNDTYGHHYGDFVLSELCSRIRQSLRKTDVLGRLGGDEFGVILNDVPEGQVRAITEALIRSVRDEPFVKGKAAVTKTISIGGLCVPGTHATHDVQALLDEADNLMYEAKRSGRKQARLRWWTKPVAPELV